MLAATLAEQVGERVHGAPLHTVANEHDVAAAQQAPRRGSKGGFKARVTANARRCARLRRPVQRHVRCLGSGKRDASHLPSAVCPWLWVDVDGTSETGEATERKRVEANKLVPPIGRPFNWNVPLFDALRRELIVGGASGCDQGSVLLFTAYDATHAGNTNHPLRCELREWLELSRAIHVSGVATSLDPIYDRGIGGYYRDVIEPVERAALRSEAVEGGACAVEVKCGEVLVGAGLGMVC